MGEPFSARTRAFQICNLKGVTASTCSSACKKHIRLQGLSCGSATSRETSSDSVAAGATSANSVTKVSSMGGKHLRHGPLRDVQSARK